MLDTSTVIAIIKNRKTERKLEEALFNRKEVSMNGISYYEVKRGLLAESAAKQLDIFNKLCEKIKILLLDNKTIFDKASEIYADLKKKRRTYIRRRHTDSSHGYNTKSSSSIKRY